MRVQKILQVISGFYIHAVSLPLTLMDVGNLINKLFLLFITFVLVILQELSQVIFSKKLDMPIAHEPKQLRRRKSFICNGFPGEDPLVEHTTDDDGDHDAEAEADAQDVLSKLKVKPAKESVFEDMSNTSDEDTTPNLITSGRLRRPSFLSKYIKKVTKDSKNDDVQTQKGLKHNDGDHQGDEKVSEL